MLLASIFSVCAFANEKRSVEEDLENAFKFEREVSKELISTFPAHKDFLIVYSIKKMNHNHMLKSSYSFVQREIGSLNEWEFGAWNIAHPEANKKYKSSQEYLSLAYQQKLLDSQVKIYLENNPSFKSKLSKAEKELRESLHPWNIKN